MKIIMSPPPNWEKILKTFPKVDIEHVVVTYGEILYIPGGKALSLTRDLMEHEIIHTLQQKKMGVELWWDKYCDDPEFRVKQEVEAYHVQYKKIQTMSKNRDWVFKQLQRLARDLSGEGYGSVIGFMEAMNRIKKGE